MNIRDGYAMKAAVESGYNVCIISGGSNEGVRQITQFRNYRHSLRHK
jgi:3-deoxy-D-manno-octulosonate 8-phosphate phosphatase KdsC-like HAD superfamily phosphatase